MRPKNSSTDFAPAMRSSSRTIHRQVKMMSDLPALQQIADCVPDMVLVLNKNRQIIFANRVANETARLNDLESAYGLRLGELLGCIHAIESEGGCGTTLSCSTCGEATATLSGLGGKADVQDYSLILKETGDALDLRAYASPFALGGDLLCVFVLSDISHKKRREVLEHTFFHDIMNTLTGLHGYAEILMDIDVGEAAQFREPIFNISNSLIDQIRAQQELMEAESGDLSVYPVSVDSLDMLREVADTNAGLEVAKERRVVVASSAQQTMLTTDKTLLIRVLGNMVKNALEASQPGDVVTMGCIRRERKSSSGCITPDLYFPRFSCKSFSVHFRQRIAAGGQERTV